MTKNRLIKEHEPAKKYNWQCVLKSTRAYRDAEYAVMFSITGKDRRLVLHFSDAITKRMKWRKGDRITILTCLDNMVVALKRAVGDEPGMMLTARGSERLRAQFHGDIANEIGVTGRVVVDESDVLFEHDLLVVPMNWFNCKEQA